MNEEYIRSGPLMEVGSYPNWAQDMIMDCAPNKKAVVHHEFCIRMRDAQLTHQQTRDFLVGVFPVIEQFPQYMAMNLLKVQYGRNRGHDMARRFLIRNIRVEQNHAEHWAEWAEQSGITREDLIYGDVALPIHALAHWCWHTCDRDTLAAAMAATNYAVEGATGEWAALICSKDTYEQTFPVAERRKAMRWLKQHADYDDTHPWEALEIVCTIMGNNPPVRGIHLLGTCVRKSYDYMTLFLDHCLETADRRETRFSPAILMENWRRTRQAA